MTAICEPTEGTYTAYNTYDSKGIIHTYITCIDYIAAIIVTILLSARSKRIISVLQCIDT